MFGITKIRILFLIFASVLFCRIVPVYAQEVMAVLSSDLRPYEEALSGFEEAFGNRVPRLNLATEQLVVRGQSRIVVAFGGKAALADYPNSVTLIYCLAPGTQLPSNERHRSIKIHMLPRADVVVKRLNGIQPALKKLAVFWSADAMSNYLGSYELSASGNFEVLSERIEDPDGLPVRLRAALQQGVDGLWLPPDPLLINAQRFGVLKAFCLSNAIPLYVPTAGLVEKDAVASVSTSFRQIGQTAGQVARRVHEGQSVDSVIYPSEMEVFINLNAAKETGLHLSAEILSNADKVMP